MTPTTIAAAGSRGGTHDEPTASQRPAGAANRATHSKRSDNLIRSATAHLRWAICGAVCWTVTGGPALPSQKFDDLTATITQDGSCFQLHIDNRLAGALIVGKYTVDAPILVVLDVVRGSGDAPEQITITTDDSYFADPPELVLADEASVNVLICQRVGA